MPFYQRDDVRIHYDEAGSGYPVLLFGPGGMNSTIEAWQRLEHIDPLALYRDDVRVIAMDQRNAGESTGPIPADLPWDSLFADQVGLLDHLGVDRCILMGCCIGCSYILRFIQQTPERVQAAVLMQPIGRPTGAPPGMADHTLAWGRQLMHNRPDIDEAGLERFVDNMWRKSDFVYSVSRDFVRSCRTPMLVLPGNDRAHPHEIGVEVAALAPSAEMIDPWKDPPEVLSVALERIRSFFAAQKS